MSYSTPPATSSSNPVAAPDLRYPIGRFDRPAVITPDDLTEAISVLAEFPTHLRNAVDGLDPGQLDTPYREGGWTVRQLVHHIADSHSHAAIRTRFALTEDWPTIMVYNEKAWAELHDACTAPVEWSLELIESLHARWVMLLQTLTPQQLQRGFRHPERGPMALDVNTLLYAWHCRHHTAHITHLRARMQW